MRKYFLLLIPVLLFATKLSATELIIGEARVTPGIVFIFEGAIKDQITPSALHLSEDNTDVHIEARVNWDVKNVPPGTPAGGFVAYLHITAQVSNQKTGLSTFVDLLPHINLIDNFHYARNITLPGSHSDLYTVKFTVQQPTQTELGLHRDWVRAYSASLMKGQAFQYKNINFKKIAESTRK